MAPRTEDGALIDDVGPRSEEDDTALATRTGDTPRALSHLALVRAASALEVAAGAGTLAGAAGEVGR